MQIKVYTSETTVNGDRSLNASIHFSLLEHDGGERPLNRGMGILYAKASVDREQILHERFLKDPTLTVTADSYVIRAVSFGAEEAEIAETVFWSTKDFIHFNTIPPVIGSFSEVVEIGDEVGYKAWAYWGAADASASNKGHFPLAKGYGDPVLYFRDGKWYFIATNDNSNDIGLFVRRAESIPALFAEGYEESCILDVDQEKGFISCFWAPEFHDIGGSLWILFTVSDQGFNPQSHMMRLKDGGDLLNPDDWEVPRLVLRKNGEALCHGSILYNGNELEGGGITLDMTWIPAGNKSYVVWSYRKNIGTPLDTGSMLCIAEADEDMPYRLRTDPVILSRPLFGWENRNGTINNEGPYAIVQNETVYLTYAGGSANGDSYVTGLLTADIRDSLCDPAVWTKRPAPLQDSSFCLGEYGPGHGAAFRDEKGDWWFSYHAKMTTGEARRDVGIRRIHFTDEGDLFIGPEAL